MAMRKYQRDTISCLHQSHQLLQGIAAELPTNSGKPGSTSFMQTELQTIKSIEDKHTHLKHIKKNQELIE